MNTNFESNPERRCPDACLWSTLLKTGHRLEEELGKRWPLAGLLLLAILLLLAFQQVVSHAVRQGELQRSEHTAKARARLVCEAAGRTAERLGCRNSSALLARLAPRGGDKDSDPVEAGFTAARLDARDRIVGTSLALSR